MKYIAKHKEKNSFRAMDDIDEFKIEDFNYFDLFMVNPINSVQYKEIKRVQKIEELKKELAMLGVDLNALTPQALPNGVFAAGSVLSVVEPQMPPQAPQMPQAASAMPNTPLAPSTELLTTENGEKLSKVKNPKTKQFYTMKEIEDSYNKIREQIEKDIPEIRFSFFDEQGIKLSLIEIRHDVPRMLPNGIPIIQTTGISD